MAAILLDVDGVLHVSGAPIAGAVDAVRRLRDAGHRLRFVTNSTTHVARAARRAAARRWGSTIDDDELQTTGSVAARVLAGQARARADDAGHPRRPRGPAARRDERRRGPDRRRRRERGDRAAIFSYLNLNRAFLELEAGAELYCLHKNRWWQTADGAAARRRRVRRRARVRGRHRGDRARQAEPRVLRARRSRRSTPTRS